MLHALVTLLLALGVSSPDAAGLRATAPDYLDARTSVEHLMAARIAAAITTTDADLLLSIAYHESRYTLAVTPETGGLVSCGTMTPEPGTRAQCARSSATVLDGYLAGAVHLRGWMEASPDLRTALLGYAGGYRLIARCKTEPLTACRTPEVFLGRAAWIKRRRKPVTKETS